MSTKLNKKQLKELLSIKKDNTLQKYIDEKVISFEWATQGTDDILFDKEEILNILGIKQDLNEPLINTKEASKILGQRNNICTTSFIKHHKIPFYCLKNVKGTQRYFLKSELEAFIKFSLKWDLNFPNFVVRTHFLAETMKYVFSSSLIKELTEQECKIIEEIIFNNKTFTDVSRDINMSPETVRQKFITACKQVNYSIRVLESRIKEVTTVENENEKLKVENKLLLNKLKENSGYDIKFHDNNLGNHLIELNKFNLSARAKNVLKEVEIKTLGDLTELTRKDILKYRNMGEKTVTELDAILLQSGLKWKEDESIPIKVIVKTKKEIVSIKDVKPIALNENKYSNELKKLRSEVEMLRDSKFKDNLEKLRLSGKINELKLELEKVTLAVLKK